MSTQTEKNKLVYREPLILIAFVIWGAILGLALGERAAFLYPIGQIWLNLLFVLLVPLIFFSISSSIANIADTKRVGKLLVISAFGFPSIALPVLLMMTQLFDAGYTLINSCGDTVSSILVTRFLYGKDWYKKNLNKHGTER